MPPWKWGSSTTSPTGTVLSPQGPSPGKEEKETDFCRASAFLFRVSFQRRWQVSAFLHLLNWKEAIENSFDFQWQLMLSGYWRAKQTNRKHPQTKMSFLSCYFFFIPFFLEEQCLCESTGIVNTRFANIQTCFPICHMPLVRQSSVSEEIVVLCWCFTRPWCGGCGDQF